MLNQWQHKALLVWLVFMSFLSYSQQIKSPDGRIVIDIEVTSAVHYSITVDGQPLLKDAVANIHFNADNNQLPPLTIAKSDKRSEKRVITPVIKQKSAAILEEYNELTLYFTDSKSVVFRAFNNGVAYRHQSSSSDDLTVYGETLELNFASDTLVYFPEEKSFISHNERAYLKENLSAIAEPRFASLPLMVDTGTFKVVITETALKDYPGLWLAGMGQQSLRGIFPQRVLKSELKPGSDRNENIIARAPDIAFRKANSEQEFPWRLFAIARNDGELITNQLSYLLADELKIVDPSWIKPGKVAWDWWNANNLYGVDFKSGINTQTYKYFIDFAAQFGMEYIVLDEGWYKLGNVLDVVEDIDVEQIIQYGKQKNVGVILWVIWETLNQQMEKALSAYANWGAAGIKVDFMQRDDQAMVQYYWTLAEKAAQHKLLVDFHGSYKPAGLRRAYPNVLTREGVRGLEHNKWADYITSEHNLTLPFIRMLAGPMDYTPGAMVNAQPDNFKVSFNRPMSKTTRAHQVAMYVVYESPLQMLADSPSHYLSDKQCTEFISKIPTVWDETKVLSAKIGEHIVIARRYGKTWYLAAMTNDQTREIELDLTFLPSGSFTMTSLEDGANADRYASDYQLKTVTVKQNSKVSIKMAANGGWAAIIDVN